MLWFSSQQIPLPEEVWLATACALELATYKGGMRKSVAGRAHPEIYHRAVLADSDIAIADWRARKDRGEIATALSYPRLNEVSFSSLNSVDKQIQFGDWKTLNRWRQTAAYRVAWLVNILVARQQGDQPISIAENEYAMLQDLLAQAAEEHAELQGMPKAIPPPRLIKRKQKPLAHPDDR